MGFFFYFSLNIISVVKPTLAAYGPAVSINMFPASALPYSFI